jgi:hypothetical protein
MNKAFVREPESDGRAYCPRCGSLGIPVSAAALDTHIRDESRARMRESAWFCNFPRCDAAYFNEFDEAIAIDELVAPVYPKDLDAPICACFGFTYDDVEADIREGKPTRIRELLAKSKTPAANCPSLAADGRCCMAVVQELYMRMQNAQ